MNPLLNSDDEAFDYAVFENTDSEELHFVPYIKDDKNIQKPHLISKDCWCICNVDFIHEDGREVKIWVHNPIH